MALNPQSVYIQAGARLPLLKATLTPYQPSVPSPSSVSPAPMTRFFSRGPPVCLSL